MSGVGYLDIANAKKCKTCPQLTLVRGMGDAALLVPLLTPRFLEQASGSRDSPMTHPVGVLKQAGGRACC